MKKQVFGSARVIPGRTRSVVWEFWPAELRRLFLQAGIQKLPAPPIAPECRGADGLLEHDPELAPVLVSPRPGLVSAARLSAPQKIPLLAGAAADAACVYLFADNHYLGRSTPEEPLFWQAVPGVAGIAAVDDPGRSSSLAVMH